MEGKRGLFALPGNGSGTNRLGGWLKVLAAAATRIDLMGSTEGSKCQYLFISATIQCWGRLVQEHVTYVCLKTYLFANMEGEMGCDIQLKSRRHLRR